MLGFVRLAQRRAAVAGNVLHDGAEAVVVQIKQPPGAAGINKAWYLLLPPRKAAGVPSWY